MPSDSASAAGRRLETVTGYALVAAVALSAIPLGSNRPAFWMAMVAVVSGIGAVHLTGLAWRGRRLPTGIGWPAAGFLAVCGWIVVQALPLGLAPHPAWRLLGPEAVGALSATPAESLAMAARYGAYAIAFLVAAGAAARTDRAVRMITALGWCITAECLYALYALVQGGDTLLFLEKEAYQGYATGTFVNRNSFATYAAFGVVIALARAVSVFGSRHRIRAERTGSLLARATRVLGRGSLVHVASLAICLAALLASGSRLGLASGLAGCALVVVVAAVKSQAVRKVLAAGALAATALAAAVLLRETPTGERVLTVDRDLGLRIEIWRQTLDLVAERPLAGHGAGSFELTFPSVQSPPLPADLIWDRAHNTYLELAAELGLPATAVLLLVLAGLSAVVLRGALIRAVGWSVPTAAAGVVVVAALHSLGDFSLQIPAVALMFATLLGIGFAQSVNAGADRAGEIDRT